MFARAFCALAGLACAAGMLVLSTPVLAAEHPTAAIQIDDLDLNSRQGMARFERRVRAAAHEVCRSTDLRIKSRAACFSEFRAIAMSKAELAMGEKPIQTARH